MKFTKAATKASVTAPPLRPASRIEQRLVMGEPGDDFTSQVNALLVKGWRLIPGTIQPLSFGYLADARVCAMLEFFHDSPRV